MAAPRDRRAGGPSKRPRRPAAAKGRQQPSGDRRRKPPPTKARKPPPSKKRGGAPTGRAPARKQAAGREERAAPTERGSGGERRRRPEEPSAKEQQARRAGWGSVARHGARTLDEPAEGSASGAWRQAMARARERDRDRPPPVREEPERWVRDDLRDEASRAVGRAERDATPSVVPRPSRSPRRKPSTSKPPSTKRAPSKQASGDQPRQRKEGPVESELARTDPARAQRLVASLREATRAFERERYQDARKLLRRLAERAPGVAPVRELYGLTLYRMGSYRLATRELEAFRTLTGTTEQHPVLADSYRALKRYRQVEELWDELRTASPRGDLVTEGRIVMAGSLADRGDVRGAIALLEQAPPAGKRPKPHHLRLWYALADLYERFGEVPRARELFGRVAAHEPDFADVDARLESLG